VAILDHVRDTQVLKGDQVVPLNQRVGHLGPEILAPVGDVEGMAGNDADGLSPVGPALLAAADPALKDPEPCLFPAIPPGMPDHLAVRGGDEGGEANIDPDLPVGRGKRVRRRLAGDAGVPAARRAPHPQGLGDPLKRPVPPDGDSPDARQPAPLAVHLPPVPVFLESEGVEPVAPLEAGVAGLLAGLDPARLLHLADIALLGFPGFLPLGQAIVEEAAAGLDRALQEPALGAGGVQAVAEGLHGLDPLWGFDIPTDGVPRDTARRGREVGAGPERGQLGEGRVLEPQFVRCEPLDLPDHLARRVGGLSADTFRRFGQKTRW